MDTESLARFKMITSNQMIGPGKCAGCGKYSNDDFLDFGLEVDFYGVVYFCRECLTEAAMTFGYRPDSHYKKMQVELERLKIELTGSLEREEALRNALASVNASFTRPSIDPISFASVEPDEDTGHPREQTDPGKSGSNEQGNEQGSSDLLHDDSIESLLGQSGLDI